MIFKGRGIIGSLLVTNILSFALNKSYCSGRLNFGDLVRTRSDVLQRVFLDLFVAAKDSTAFHRLLHHWIIRARSQFAIADIAPHPSLVLWKQDIASNCFLLLWKGVITARPRRAPKQALVNGILRSESKSPRLVFSEVSSIVHFETLLQILVVVDIVGGSWGKFRHGILEAISKTITFVRFYGRG